MNKIIIKITTSLVSLGLVTYVGVLTTNQIKQEKQLTYIAKNDQKESSLKSPEQVEEELNEAKEAKKEAEQELKNAEETIQKALKEKEEATAELENVKTAEEKEEIQARIDAATEKMKQAEETKKSAEEKVEKATSIVEEKEQDKQITEETKKSAEEKVEKATSVVEEKEQNKQITEEKIEEAEETTNKEVASKASNTNSTTTNSTTQSPTKSNATTEQKDGSEEQGNKFDLDKYQWLLDKVNKTTEEQLKEIEEEAKKKTVEFHFYSSNKELMLRCRGDHCGEDQQGYIWFVELECDLNKCEGFTNTTTGTKVSKLLLGRRGDITNYTVTAPAAKSGYKFVGWELVSTRKVATNELGTGALLGKYIATYEKI